MSGEEWEAMDAAEWFVLCDGESASTNTAAMVPMDSVRGARMCSEVDGIGRYSDESVNGYCERGKDDGC